MEDEIPLQQNAPNAQNAANAANAANAQAPEIIFQKAAMFAPQKYRVAFMPNAKHEIGNDNMFVAPKEAEGESALEVFLPEFMNWLYLIRGGEFAGILHVPGDYDWDLDPNGLSHLDLKALFLLKASLAETRKSMVSASFHHASEAWRHFSQISLNK